MVASPTRVIASLSLQGYLSFVMGVQRKTQLIAIVDDDESVCSAMCSKRKVKLPGGWQPLACYPCGLKVLDVAH